MTLVYVLGARPNFVKMAPVVAALRTMLPTALHVVVHTGQHYDPMLSSVFVDELQLPKPDYLLGVGSGDHGAQTARALAGIEEVLRNEQPAAVVVAGDVNSTLAGALAAVKLEIPVAHVEAGLRSFDRSMPEEVNRVLVDQVSRWCFTHSPEARDNLLREGIAPERIHSVGNTMIDTLVWIRPHIARSDVHNRIGVARRRYVLATLHRPALVDGHLLVPTLESLARLAASIPVVFPVHPRTRARMPVGFAADGLHLIDPVGYVDFLALEEAAYAVVTDSGGVQEETTYLRVPCFTLRSATERPVTVTNGTNTILGLDPRALERVFELASGASVPLSPPDGWDGRAAGRIAAILAADLEQALGTAVEA
jgi:UDP-N-acetylglucosamine 2-epimerase (non-hydrolysing)